MKDLGKYDQAIEYYERSLEMRKQIYGDMPHPDVADSLNNLGNALKDLGKYNQAIEYYERSLEMKKQIYGDKPHPNMADSLNNLGVVLKKKRRHRKSQAIP